MSEYTLNSETALTGLAVDDYVPIYDTSAGALMKASVSSLRDVIGGIGAPTSLATAGAATYTIAQILTGIIVRDCAGAGRTDVLPTAALIVAGLTSPYVGQRISFRLINGSDAAETITLSAGTGGGFDTNQVSGSQVVAQNTSKVVTIRLTNVTASSEAYVAYA